MDSLNKYLHLYINDPLDPYINAQLGEEYDKIGQGAAALSYFLRAAELLHDTDKDLAYNCLLKTWKQLNKIGRRKKWEKCQLELAISYNPTRPEAYLFMSLFSNDFHTIYDYHHQSYMYACLGLQYIDKKPLKYDVGYLSYLLYFQKAFHGWYIAKRDESKKLWAKLGNMPNILPEHKKIIDHNNKIFGNTSKNLKPIKFNVNTLGKNETKEYYIND